MGLSPRLRSHRDALNARAAAGARAHRASLLKAEEPEVKEVVSPRSESAQDEERRRYERERKAAYRARKKAEQEANGSEGTG